MDKLEERFEEILDCNIDYKQLPTGEDIWDYADVFKYQAKEAKEMAIEFARAADSILIDCEFNEVVTHEEAFEKFINARYE